MNDTLVRRGPDGEGSFCGSGVGLAMRRLSIIDIHGSNQPIWSHDRQLVCVFNGEIYNYQELRQTLMDHGVSFRTEGDGEVLVNLFRTQGLQGLTKLRGMFAAAIWDLQRRQLTVVRDPMGIKPLFYSVSGTALVFGSEPKAVLASNVVDRTVDPQAVDAYLAYTYIPAPLTIYRSIRKLEPGSALVWQDGRLEVRAFDTILPDPPEDRMSPEQIRHVLDRSIRDHMVSDVPVGAFLSGGIDSSTIVARMQAASEIPVHAHSIRFEADDSHLFDETPFARLLQQQYGFELEEHTVSYDLEDALDEAISAFDEPFADDSLVPTSRICEIAARDLKVCVSGAGGDELFGGYNRYQGLALQAGLNRFLARPLQRLIRSAALPLMHALPGMHSRRGDLMRRFISELGKPLDQVYLDYITAIPWEQRRNLYRPEFARQIDPQATAELITDHYNRIYDGDHVRAAMYADTRTYLPEDVLALSDRLGMWHSLEIRVPFADKEVLSAAFSLASLLHVTASDKKISLKEATREWLPDAIFSHPKQGFESPMASWLRGPVGERMAQQFSKATAPVSEIMDTDEVLDLLSAHRARKSDRAKSLFSFLVLARWLKAI